METPTRLPFAERISAAALGHNDSPTGQDHGSVEAASPYVSGCESTLRQLHSKLAADLVRETLTSRADNIDLWTRGLQDSLGQSTTEGTGLQESNVSRALSFEALARSAGATLGEVPGVAREVEKIYEMLKHCVFAAFSEETRGHRAAVQRERHAREAMCRELEDRFRAQLEKERQLRSIERDHMMMRLTECEKTFSAKLDMQIQCNSDVVARMEDLTQEIRGKASQWQIQQLAAQIEELHVNLDASFREALDGEAHKRADVNDAIVARISAAEHSQHQSVDQTARDFTQLRHALTQSTTELRTAIDGGMEVREKEIARLQELMSFESKLSKEAAAKEATLRESLQADLEHQLRCSSSETHMREQGIERRFELAIGSLQRDIELCCARADKCAKELEQALSEAHGALGYETATCRSEVGLLVSSLDEVRNSLSEEAAGREKVAAHIWERLGALDTVMREECRTREAVERRLVSENTEVNEKLNNLAKACKKLQLKIGNSPREHEPFARTNNTSLVDYERYA